LSGGNYLGRFDIAQQWRVTGENRRVLANYPVYNAIDFYTGNDFLTAVSTGEKGNWTCEAVFNIYNNYPDTPKLIMAGDSIGWEIRYSDSDDKTWNDNQFIADYFVGWVYSGPAATNADFFGRLVFEPAPEQKSITVTHPAADTTWYLGDSGLISWISTGSISAVKIEISRTAGASWTTLADSLENSGEFRWIISGDAADSCQIKISDFENHIFAASAFFQIAEKPALQITSPQNGDHWYVGQRYSIAWTSRGFIQLVALALSRDGGQTWEDLGTAFNVGQSLWTVSGPVSDQCQIRISDSQNSDRFAISGIFSIEPEPQLRLDPLAPIWYIGRQTQIKWSFAGQIDSIKIELTRNHGEIWEHLGKALAADQMFNWQVTGPAADQCQIRIADSHNPERIAISGVFSIEPAPWLRLDPPAAIWYIGRQTPIKWSFAGSIDSIAIQLTRNQGENWEYLGNAPAADQIFNWQVTGPVAVCQVKITTTHPESLTSESAPFEIAEVPQLRILAPDFGAVWYVGSHSAISWISQGNFGSVRISLTRDSGANWEVLGQALNAAGTFDWLVTGEPSSNCRILLENWHNPAVNDTSDFSFRIDVPRILVTPLAEILFNFTEIQINWQSAGPIKGVNIELSRTAGESWETLAERISNSGNFTWQISGTPAAACLIRISDADHAGTFGVSAVFSIKNPAFSLQSPTGGEVWEIDSHQEIRWETEGSVPQVKIEIKRDAEEGNYWEQLAEAVANSGSFKWQVSGATSSFCKVRISDTRHPEISATSADFTIAEIPFLQIQKPAGYAIWQINSVQTIQWHSNSRIQSVNIKISRDARATWQTLTREIPNSGNFDWTVTEPEARLSCFIRILSTQDSSLFTENQWPFSIENAPISPELALTAPAGESRFVIGTLIPIRWQVTGSIALVKIELSRDGGQTWRELTTTNAANSVHHWPIQPPTCRQGRLRISDPTSPATAISDTLEFIAPAIQELVNPSSQPAGTSQNGYRLISIPLDIRQPQADSVLRDDLGMYDKNTWRLFDLQNGSYREFPAVGDFSPGKSMFLIVRDPYRILDAGPGVAIMSENFSIPLVTGWNFVSNPYETRISGALSVDDLTLASQEAIILYNYEGAWGISRDFKPWTGYAIKTSHPDTLKIQPNWDGGFYKAPMEIHPAGWQMRIVATCQNAIDSLNYVGTASDASLTRDEYDRYEPPPIGEFVQVYFPHAEWRNAPDDYTFDFQPPRADGNAWEFVVTSNIENPKITLGFTEIRPVPAGHQVILLNPEFGIRVELTSPRHLIQLQLRENIKYSFKLLVGNAAFVEDSAGKYATPPANFMVFPNFPNPFNSRTVIRFYLPEKCEIEASIYNLLGAQVAQLIPQTQFEPGFFQVDWDAKNTHGEELASGIYLLGIKTDAGQVQFQKLVLVK